MNACDVSEQVAGHILCLPIYHDLSEKEVERIANIVNSHCE
jgi:dTDP-4-amino-4,6-dideoxygalactose transaminase